MNISYILLLASTCIAMVGGIAFAGEHKLNLWNGGECQHAIPFTQTTQLLIVDRTTEPNYATKQRYADGIEKIIRNRDNSGRLVVLEPRQNATESRLLGDGCLEPAPAPPPNPADVSWATRILNLATSAISYFFGFKDDTEERLSEEADFSRSLYQHRKNDAEAIKSLINDGEPTESDTEIESMLVGSIDSYCSERRECHVYIFSDLLDSRARRAAQVLKGDPTVLGQQQGKMMLDEFQPQIDKTNVYIKTWGFGRSDINANKALSDLERSRLRKYWEAFFGEIIKSSSSGSFKILDLYEN